jgi:hypothetical protein
MLIEYQPRLSGAKNGEIYFGEKLAIYHTAKRIRPHSLGFTLYNACAVLSI